MMIKFHRQSLENLATSHDPIPKVPSYTGVLTQPCRHQKSCRQLRPCLNHLQRYYHPKMIACSIEEKASYVWDAKDSRPC